MLKWIVIAAALFLPNISLAENFYEIRKVDVYATDPDLSKARTKAMKMAEQQAFDKLQDKLIASRQIRQKVKVAPLRISNSVDALDVIREKFTTEGYRAQLNVRFNPSTISSIFGVSEIKVAPTPDKYLIIPIITQDGKTKLWKHDWWNTWSKITSTSIVLPVRELQDIKELTEEDIANNNIDSIFKMMERYKANNIAMIRATYKIESNSLEVELEKINDIEKTVVTYEYPGSGNLKESDLLVAAAEDIVNRLETDKLTEEENTTGVSSTPADVYTPAPVDNSVIHNSPYQQPELKPANSDQLPPVTGYQAAPPPKIDDPLASGTDNFESKVQTQAEPSFDQVPGKNYTEAYVEAPDLLSWNHMRGKIMNTHGVTGVQIRSFTAGRAYITISHDNNISELKSLLDVQDLAVSKDGNNLVIKEK